MQLLQADWTWGEYLLGEAEREKERVKGKMPPHPQARAANPKARKERAKARNGSEMIFMDSAGSCGRRCRPRRVREGRMMP